jgi:aldehyde:ferredoxin oxidoreductase
MYAFSSNLDHTIIRSKLLSKAFSYVTGMIPEEESLDFLVEAGERLTNLERMYNIREGLSRKDDLLPERFRFEPLPEGPAKGSVIEEDQILDEYYEERGWDKETGIPLDSTLKRLKLKI